MIILGLTLGQFIVVTLIFLVAIVLTLLSDMEIGTKVMLSVIEIALTVIAICIIGYFNSHTASGVRMMKDVKSEYNNGLEREIIIQKEDGEEIYHYEGKVDIESDHTDNYIKFEDEDGKRQIIYYGITDRVFVKEK